MLSPRVEALEEQVLRENVGDCWQDIDFWLSLLCTGCGVNFPVEFLASVVVIN